MLVLIAIVASVTFDGFWAMAAPVFAYFGLTTLKAFLAVILLGRRLVLNPVAVLIGLILFDWMWGLSDTLLPSHCWPLLR